jgi:hypothetical protein
MGMLQGMKTLLALLMLLSAGIRFCGADHDTKSRCQFFPIASGSHHETCSLLSQLNQPITKIIHV